MSQNALIDQFRKIVGTKNVLTSDSDTAYYRTGFRYGHGGASAVVFPESLLDQWRVLKAAVEARCIIIMQAAKTGLTGGSSPSGEDYDRDVIIINISRIRKITLLAGGDQVLAFPGTTLFELTQELRRLQPELVVIRD